MVSYKYKQTSHHLLHKTDINSSMSHFLKKQLKIAAKHACL